MDTRAAGMVHSNSIPHGAVCLSAIDVTHGMVETIMHVMRPMLLSGSWSSYIHFSSHNLFLGCNLVPDFTKRAPLVPQLVCAGELGPNSPNPVPRRLELADSLFAN
jgi:hypothetical protein